MFYEIPAKRNYCAWPEAKKSIGGVNVYTNEYIRIPIISDNILIVGKTGFGKSTFTKKTVDKFLEDENNQLTVFLDVKNDFREYIRGNDKAVCFTNNNEGMNVFRWNLISEIRQSDDWESELEEISGMLFSDLMNDGKNRFWVEAAKSVFKAYLKTILYCYKNSPSNKQVIDGLKYMSKKQLISHIAEYRPNSNVLRDYLGYSPNEPYKEPRRAGDVMAFLNTVLEKFIGPFYSNDGTDTVHDFLDNKYGTRLFLVYDYGKRASSNIFFRLILHKIIENRLSQQVDRDKKVLLVLDEAATLECDFGLMEAATLGRGNNLHVILSTQSLEKIYCIAPELNAEHITNAALAGFPTIVSFSPGDPLTVDKLQKIYGNRKKQFVSLGISRYSQPSVEIKTEPIVTAEELSSMGIGECYVKIRDADPQRVKILL